MAHPRRHVSATTATDERGGCLVVTLDAVHRHECPFWRFGTRHGPCNCGANEMWDAHASDAGLIARALRYTATDEIEGGVGMERFDDDQRRRMVALAESIEKGSV